MKKKIKNLKSSLFKYKEGDFIVGNNYFIYQVVQIKMDKNIKSYDVMVLDMERFNIKSKWHLYAPIGMKVSFKEDEIIGLYDKETYPSLLFDAYSDLKEHEVDL